VAPAVVTVLTGVQGALAQVEGVIWVFAGGCPAIEASGCKVSTEVPVICIPKLESPVVSMGLVHCEFALNV
jgi:hypothetical protein